MGLWRSRVLDTPHPRYPFPPTLCLILVKAVLLGLEGNLPDKTDPSIVNDRVADIRTSRKLNLFGKKVPNTCSFLCEAGLLTK